jgi:hypothetical protein
LIKLAQKYIEDLERTKRPFWTFQIEPTLRYKLRCAVRPRTCFLKKQESRDIPSSSPIRYRSKIRKSQEADPQVLGPTDH